MVNPLSNWSLETIKQLFIDYGFTVTEDTDEFGNDYVEVRKGNVYVKGGGYQTSDIYDQPSDLEDAWMDILRYFLGRQEELEGHGYYYLNGKLTLRNPNDKISTSLGLLESNE